MIGRQFLRANHSFSQLQGILSQMKVKSQHQFPESISKLGNTDMFMYAIDKKQEGQKQQITDDINNNNNKQHESTKQLETWNKLVRRDLEHAIMKLPANGFEELIQLTEQGRLWKYPIDNEQGMEAEQAVPFEEHVFLDKHLEGFPDNEYVRTFMGFITAGLARNNWMTVERKREAIKFYKDYFESKREAYKMAGFDL